MGKRIAGVARQTIADGSLASGVVVTGHTNGIGAAWIRLTQILLGEGAAAHKGIAGHVPRAAADGCQAAQIAIGAHAAGAIASVLANAIEACRSASRTIRIAITFRPAFRIRTTNIALGAFAQCPMIRHRLAVGANATLATRWHTLEIAAHVTAAAVTVSLALMATAAQRIAQVAMHAGAGGHSINNLTFGVNAARARMALFLCKELLNCMKAGG